MLRKQISVRLLGAIALVFLFFSASVVKAQQSNWCGTQPTLTQIEHLNSTHEARDRFDVSTMRGSIRWVPVTWHLFRATNGTGGLSLNSIPGIMALLNNKFAGANIQFYICSAPKEILDDTYYSNLSGTEAVTYGNQNDVANTMNVYVPATHQYGTGGYSYFPGGPERVVVTTSSVGGEIFLHEVGHFFALYHTHGNDKSAEGYFIVRELVNGSNCHYAGDDVCDTPADNYDHPGDVNDANGDPYAPDHTNYMSYYNGNTHFTPGQYNHMAYAAIYDRPNLGCNSNPVPCGTPITSFPHNMGFESGSFGSWAQGTTDDFNWTAQTGSTPTASTGPDNAQAGSYYAYTEVTGNNPFKTAELYSPCMDLTYTTSPELTFYYHMYGTNCGSLRAQVSNDAGITWTTVFTKYGNQGNAWTQATVDLKQYVNETFFRIRFIVASESGGDLGDIAIDNVDIHSKSCAGTTASVSHTDLGCQYVSNASVTATVSGASSPFTYLWSNGATTSSITNVGSGAYKVTVTDNNACTTTLGAWVDESLFRVYALGQTPASTSGASDGTVSVGFSGGASPYSLTYTGVTMSSQTGTISSITGSSYTITGLEYGDYRIELTDANGCKQGITNLHVGSYACQPLGTINSLPYSEGFESGTGLWDFGCTYGNSFFFLRNSGSTPQANTGPDAASEGSYYMYADVLNHGTDPNTTAPGPLVDFTSYTRPNISFKYHQYGADCNSLRLFTYSGYLPLGTPNVTIWQGPTGNQGNQWNSVTVDMKFLAGKSNWYLLLTANAPTGAGTEGEIAIDDIQIFECGGTTITRSYQNVSCQNNDGTAGVTVSGAGSPYTYLWSTGATTSSISGRAAGTYTVTVTASNGCVFVESFTLSTILTIASTQVTHQTLLGSNDGAIDLSVTEGVSPFTYSWTGGATTQDLANLNAGTYTVTITDARGCTTQETAIVNPGSCVDFINTYPYNESFETNLGAWSNVTGDDFDWTGPFTGSTPTANTGPDAAANGTKYLYTEATGNYPNKTAYLVSKCFDLSGTSAASFGFKYHMYTNNKSVQMGSLSIQVSTDNGTSWSSNIWTISGDQGNSWQTGTQSLTTYCGKSIKLRFVGITGTGGDRGDRGLDQLSLTVTAPKADEAPGVELGPKAFENVALYPNPTTGDFNISFDSFDEQEVDIRIVDIAGKVISQQKIAVTSGTNKIEMNAGVEVSGMYFVEITSGESRVIKRLIISK